MSVVLPANSTAKRPLKPRTMRIERDPFGGGLVRLTVGDKSCDYATTMIPCDPTFGPFAFQFTKVEGGETYHLTCSSSIPNTALIKCDCKGHVRHNHCKHADCLRYLMLHLDA